MRFLISILAFLLLSTDLFSFSGGGSGTEEDPYQITTVEQLQEMNTDESHLSAHYILMNDIDAGDTRNWNFGDHDQNADTPDSAMGFVPVGNYYSYDDQTPFEGKIDGNGYKIECLYINRHKPNLIGLFGFVSSSAEIKNLGITNCEISGKNIGGLVGVNYGKLNNCYVYGKLLCKGSGGGVAGMNWGSINDSYFEGEILGMNSVGGLVGQNEYGCSISYSYAKGNIKGNKNIGGLIGINEGGNIYNSFTDCNVSGDGNNVGGLVGHNTGSIISSYSSGTVYGYDFVGGLVGAFEGIKDSIVSSYSTALVSGLNQVGGLAGFLFGIVNRLYAIGNVNGEENIGGLIGLTFDGSIIKNSYSLGNITGIKQIGGLIGRNDQGSVHATYTSGIVTGVENVGGLIGINYGTINNSFSDCEVKGDSNAGGCVGHSYGGCMANSFAKGNVSGDINIGGLVGYNNYGLVIHSYSTGKTTGIANIGGLIGYNNSEYSVTNSFWDIQSSSIDTSAGGKGLPTVDMKIKSTFTNVSWDFDSIWAISPDINDGYPYFQSLDIIVSVEEESTTEKLAAANIYPNPANDFINISLKEKGIIKSVEINDLKGVLIKKEIFNIPADRISLTVKTIPAGYYIIRISSEKEVFALPLVIE